MSLVSGAVDLYMTYKFLRILTQPFDKTDAFKLGIIDERGKVLKKRKNLKTDEEKKSYTIFHRLIWKLKKIMEKLPLGKTRLASYAAALWFLKEEARKKGMEHPDQLETTFYNYLKENDGLPDYDDVNEQFSSFLSEEKLKKGKYKLRVDMPDSGVLDNRLGPDAKVGDIINVTKDTEPIDTVLGSEVYSVKHERTGKEIVVSQEDLFPIG